MSDELDGLVNAQLLEHHIPGLSLAIIHDGRIARAQGYGFTNKIQKVPITDSTLFQSGSVSKCLSAFAALRLVDQGKLFLDEDLNLKLNSWKIPPGKLAQNISVTLRKLLSHSAGFNLHGFPGYVAGETLPTLLEILNGIPTAKNPAILVDAIPGADSKYSGGGYTVLQQLLIDVTGCSFPELMRRLVLHPLRMTLSTFEQPLPNLPGQIAATGHRQDGKPVPGGAHVYPEMAAAGLWTTSTDLARFVMGVQQSVAGQSDALLSPSVAREMITAQTATYGLGPRLSGKGKTLNFFHSGRNVGFDSVLIAGAENGKGSIIMVNANCPAEPINLILKAMNQAAS